MPTPPQRQRPGRGNRRNGIDHRHYCSYRATSQRQGGIMPPRRPRPHQQSRAATGEAILAAAPTEAATVLPVEPASAVLPVPDPQPACNDSGPPRNQPHQCRLADQPHPDHFRLETARDRWHSSGSSSVINGRIRCRQQTRPHQPWPNLRPAETILAATAQQQPRPQHQQPQLGHPWSNWPAVERPSSCDTNVVQRLSRPRPRHSRLNPPLQK